LDDVQQIARAYEKAVESRSDLHALACRVINPENGQTVWLEVSAKIVYDAEGSPVRMFGVAQNITQSKEAQDEIASISRFPAEDPNPVMRLTPDGKILYGNPGSAPLLAAWQQPADGSIPYELQAAITQAFSTGAKTEVEIEHDGTTFSCTLAPILGAGYVNLYAKDTTERKQAERKLRESEERFRALVSQATAGIAQSDLNSSLVFVNPRFCEMLGYAEEEILGKTIWELTYTEDVEENQRLFTRMLNDGESYHFEKRFIRKDGSHLWTDVSVSTIRDLDGKAKGGVGVIIEIEDRKQAEAALKGFAREQAALYRLADQLHRTTSFEDIYNSALDAIISALECDRASILLYDDTDVMRFVAWRGLADAYRQATDGHSPWTPEVVNPAPIAMDNVDTADLSDSLRTIIKGEGIVSLAFIPLVSNGRLIGKFMVYFDEPHPFSEDDLDLSLTIARQLAFAIDRKRGEESLRTSEERFRQAADASGALIYEVDPNSGTTAIVYGMERLVGYDPEQALISSDRWRSLVHPEDLPVYLAQLEDHLKKGGTNVSEYRLHHKNGDWIIVQDNRMLVSDETGQPVRLIGAVIDITERKRIEEALRIENERFMRFVDSNIVGILIGKDDGEVVLANDYYLRLLGVTREDLMAGKVDWQKFTPREWLPADEKAIEELREYGICEPYEKEYVRSDGTLIPVYIANAMLPGPGEEIASFVIDITERKRAEEALRKSEERYRGIVNQSVGGISETDLTGKYIMVNDHYCEITGYTRRELLNEMRMQDITHPDDLAKNSELFARLAADGTSFEIEKRYVRPDGSIVWVHNSVSAITRIDGRPQSAVAVVIDVTERKRAEETMRRNEELFSTLVEAAPFGVYFIDSEFRLRAINKGSENVFKGIYPLIGRDFAEILRIVWQEPFATEAIERFRYTLRTGESFLSPPVIEPRANIDEIQSYDWQIHRITMPDGTYGVVCYFYDLSEQKRMEATVRASEALYRAIAGSIPGGGVYVVDKDFRYLVAEGPVTDAFGLSRKMLEGHAVTEVFPDARGERMEERLRRTFAGETISFETKHNGRVYWTRQAPLLDSIGQAIILTLDITERKQAEEALRESEERFRAILRQATAGIVRKDAEGRLIFVNQAFCNMLGYTEAELLGKPIWDLMYEEDIAENKRSYDRMMVEGVPFKLERRLLREDGSMIWVDGSVSPIMDAEGRPQTSVAVEVDITGRKQAEEALHQLNLQLEERVLHRTAKLRAVNQTLREEITERKRIEEALRKSEAIAHENEAKLRSLFELLPVGISFLDLEGRVIQMNSALLNILKSSKEEFLGHTHKTRRYIRTDGTPMLPAEFASARAIAEKHTVYNVETGIVIESGEVIWTSVSAAPVDVADVSVVVVTVDITDNKRAEQALHESHARLRILSQRLVEVQEEERRALARELHDRVGQTLAALNINLIIINSQLSGEVTEHIGTRLNDSMKLVAETIALVRDVMTDLRPAVLDDYGLEAALEAHLSKFIARYDIDTRFEKPAKPLPRLGPSIEMTLLRIAQEALMNIARHAQATQVSLSVQQEPDAICMTIQDNGIGIQSWQEANRPGSHGMTIMRERAEAFGGNLRVRSVPGQGTKIEAVIPLRDRRETGQENNV
ncbi:MAG TPA: PAS domain S-box protein, partial [Anaerolineales bacterium]|nr:PAS domain S-box protein [Anaerolineales bacterium]